MQTTLAKYDAARTALQVAVTVDEVKDIRDKAVAMAAYAKQANDTALIEWATEIRVRAERRAGEMLAAQKEAGMMNVGAKGNPGGQGAPIVRYATSTAQAPTLADLGITKNQSSRWQKLAAIPDAKFELAVDAAKEVAHEVTAKAIWKAASPASSHEAAKPHKPPKRVLATGPNEVADYDPRDDQIKEASNTIAELAAENDKLKDRIAVEAWDVAEDEKLSAADIIAGLRAEVATLRAERDALIASRDKYQDECAQMKRQLAAQRREIQKLRLVA